jgi:hypothetical protein
MATFPGQVTVYHRFSRTPDNPDGAQDMWPYDAKAALAHSWEWADQPWSPEMEVTADKRQQVRIEAEARAKAEADKAKADREKAMKAAQDAAYKKAQAELDAKAKANA